MIAGLVWTVVAALAPVDFDVDACVAELVATATVASLIELELSPREARWVDGADKRVGCADAPDAVEIRVGPSVMVLALHGLGPTDRARAIALAFAEELRLREQLEDSIGEGAPGGPRLDPGALRVVSRSESDVSSPPPNMLVAGSVIKPVNDSAVVFGLHVAAERTHGTLRPRFGGTFFGGQGDQKQLFALALDLGAALIFLDTDGVDLGLDLSGSFGVFAQDKLGIFGLATAGVLLQGELGEGVALEGRLSAGSFLPAAVTTSLSVGVSFVP